MNVLITGANGFLGSNLLEKFHTNNHNVYALSVHNHNLKKFNNIQFDSVKLKDLHTIKQKIVEFKPEVVIHCAWAGGNAYKDTNSLKQLNNVTHSIDLLNILSELENVYFIGMGSMSEYGIKDFQVKEETAASLQERAPERVIQHAIAGMLPRTRIHKDIMSKLKIYAGSEHPHEAQKPVNLDI